MKKTLLVLLLLIVPQFVFAGAAYYTTPGSYGFTVPAYGTLTVQVWGGGGGGSYWNDAQSGTYSAFDSVVGYGGVGPHGVVGYISCMPCAQFEPGGPGGGASGGDINIAGDNGQDGPASSGGASPYGGSGGAFGGRGAQGAPGGAPGGGGSGASPAQGGFVIYGGGGGGGGFSQKTYSSGALPPAVTIVVGSGGAGSPTYYGDPTRGGDGASGAVYVYWTDLPPASCVVSVSPNPASYSSSGTATLSWSSSNADSWTYINNVGYLTGPGSSFQVARTASTDYSCYAQGSGGSDGWHAYTFTVTPPQPTLTISADSTSINTGQTTVIHSTYAAGAGDSMQDTAFNEVPPGSAEVNLRAVGVAYGTSPDTQYNYTFTPSTAGTYVFKPYAITSAYNSWNTYGQSVSVTVTANAPCTLNGVTMQSGESHTFYSSQTSPTGQVCSAISQTRTCTNGTLSGSSSYQYSSCTCAPLYSCSGNNVTYTNGSCSTSTVASCVSPQYCSPGTPTCVTPPPTFTSGTSTYNGVVFNSTGHIIAKPQLLSPGATARIYWNISNVSSCTTTGSNGDSWTGASSGSAGKATAAITQQTTFTLRCTGLDASHINESATVNVIPVFQEQ
ncbi:MAG: hypothetical protein JWM46_633 [Candidatus Kaiserbacteria bacterium]|nr:hypothetical protein [Candidatus Kaiserbacteria bacterium]